MKSISKPFSLPLYALITVLLSLNSVQTNAQNLTNLTEALTTTEFSTTELYTTIKPTTTIAIKDDVVEIEIEIKITLSTNNITISKLTDIVTNLITAKHDDLGILEVDIDTIDGSDSELTIIWQMVITADSESEANAVAKTIESADFKADLATKVEESMRADVLSVETEASVITLDESRPQWMDPTTYGLLNWIIVGAALCILCVLCLFIVRCCYLCCNRKARLRKKRSKYQVGGPLFDSVATDDKRASEFQNDLFQAIEMNARKSYLKKTKSPSSKDKKLGALDGADVATAFDMDFDEVRPITQQSSTEEEVRQKEKENKKKEDKKEDKKEGKEDKSQDKKKKGKESELKQPLNEGVPLPMLTTTETVDDEDEDPPKAPNAPDLTKMEDYDLL